MKKLILSLLLAGSCFFATNALAADSVVWDGAEVVYGQVGKMTFSKDVKVYKPNTDGTYTSLVVKKGNFFRVYGVENSSVGIVYNMSGGYRVQATNLVIYREVPLSIQQQLGTIFKTGSNIYVSAKEGVAIKRDPNNTSESIGQAYNGDILKVLGVKGDYLKVFYDTANGTNILLEGYVPRNSIATIPPPTTQYLTENVSLGKTSSASYNLGYYRSGQEVSAYFSTISDYTYVSIDNKYGFVKTRSLSKNKAPEKLLQKIDTPTSIAFDTTKKISYNTGYSVGGHGFEENGKYEPGTSNTLEGEIYSASDETSSTKKSSFQINISHDQLVYRIDDMTITLAFPIKVGDEIDVNGKKHKVEKILETYKPYYANFTVENAIFADDFIIAKDYLYVNPYVVWSHWSQIE